MKSLKVGLFALLSFFMLVGFGVTGSDNYPGFYNPYAINWATAEYGVEGFSYDTDILGQFSAEPNNSSRVNLGLSGVTDDDVNPKQAQPGWGGGSKCMNITPDHALGATYDYHVDYNWTVDIYVYEWYVSFKW